MTAQSPRARRLTTRSQIAEGLAAAHAKGVVHRDLKPENLFVTNDGRVKILDFGLAKLRPQQFGGVDKDAPTQKRITDPGVMMGTVGYMSPEQVRGQETDHRSDIFAFGVILYEMLSGQRAFRGDSAIEVMNAILKEEPPELGETKQKSARSWKSRAALSGEDSRSADFTPRTISALRLKPYPRLQTRDWNRRGCRPWSRATQTRGCRAARDGWYCSSYRVSARTGRHASFCSFASPRSSRQHARPQIFGVAARERPLLEATQYRWPLHLTANAWLSSRLMKAIDRVSVRSLDSLSAQPLAGTEGAAASIFWSPDGRFIAFFTNGKLKKVNVFFGRANSNDL